MAFLLLQDMLSIHSGVFILGVFVCPLAQSASTPLLLETFKIIQSFEKALVSVISLKHI